MEILLEKAGPENRLILVKHVDRHGRTALHHAAESGSVRVVELLISMGAGTQPLSLQDRLECVAFLLTLAIRGECSEQL